VIDAYTTTDRFPYSQGSENGRLTGGGLAGDSFNYVRNSVKAVVDSFDGTVAFYVMPSEDPIIRAWRAVFPELFSDFEEMPDGLRDHLRYPQDMFSVQTNMFASYQVEEAEPLILGTEAWAVAQDPGRTVRAGGTNEESTDEFGVITSREARVNPYYTLMTLPGEDDASYVTLRTFVPSSEDDERRELEAFMVGEVDRAGEARLVSYEMNSASAPGPVLVATSIAQNEEISQRLALLNTEGSSVEFSDVLLLPIDNAILWVRSLYVAADGTAVPTLENVIVSVGNGERLAIGESFSDALEKLFGENFDDILATPAGGVESVVVDNTPPPDDDNSDDEPLTAEGLLDLTVDKWAEANAALAEDPADLVAWAAALDEIDALLARAQELSAPEPVDPGEVES
jgi:uncharacterized membrane protein (UPF0182 family)